MSHVTDVKLKVHDLDALEAACDKLGLELQRGKKTYAWWGRFVGDSNAYGQHRPVDFGKGEHAIRIKGDQPQNGSAGPWEVGVVKSPDGDGLSLLYDEFGSAGGRLTERVGPGANELRKEYSAAVAMRKATKTLSKQGFRITREDLPNGRIKIKVRKK